MTETEAQAVVAVATLAALADGQQDANESAAITAVATRLGLAADTVQRVASGQVGASELALQLTSNESRQSAYDAALAVCSGNGDPGDAERAFLSQLAVTLKISGSNAVNPFAGGSVTTTVTAGGTGALPNAVTPSTAGTVPGGLSAGATTPNTDTPQNDLDNHILDQAILTAAMELLPDRLANMAILPLQMRMVYGIGQRHGQKLDAKQITDLAATFGLGAVAQVLEKAVRRALGGLAGGLLGGMLGGAGGVAAGAAVTFASTYALGHAAEQYYAQNRSLSVADMKALFTRFQAEATAMYPRVQDRIRQRASGTSMSSIMQSIRG